MRDATQVLIASGYFHINQIRRNVAILSDIEE